MRRGHIPIRTCVGCRTRKPKSEMLRLAAGGVDPGERSREGRGLYLCPNASCIEKGLRRADVKKRLGASDYAETLKIVKTAATAENCLDGLHLGRVICDECHGGGSFG